MAEAYYYFARYGFSLKKLTIKEINIVIKKGISVTNENKLIKKLELLEQEVNNKPSDIKSKKKIGVIKYYNYHKKYGILFSYNRSYTFVISAFNKYVNEIESQTLEERKVLFEITNHPKKEGEKIATSIDFFQE